MKIHTLKIQKLFYDKIRSNKKMWELRFNDRDFQIGDLIHFDILNLDGAIVNKYEDDSILWEIDYILYSCLNKDTTPSFKGLQKDYVILSIRPVCIQYRREREIWEK